jgi:uncharacterized protein (TIRG00374 family)
MTEKLRTRRWKIALNVITILALFGLTYALRAQLRDTFENVFKVKFWVLFLMIPFQALNYFCQAKFYQHMFRVLGDRFRTRSMIRFALEMNFVSTVFPSGGVSGFSYISIRLREEKVSTAKATLVQMMRFFLIFLSVQVLLFFGLVALAIGGKANDFAILLAGIIGTLIVVLTLLVGYVIGSRERINAFFVFVANIINGLIHVFRRGTPEAINISRAKRAFTELHENYMQIRQNLLLLKRPFVFALLSVTAEVLTIYTVYVAFGQWVNIGAVILAYAIANFAGLISILPGGIGIYEALMTGVLAAGGIPAVISLPVTVMYRVLNMLIQLPPGYYFYHKTLHATPAIAEHLEHEVETQDAAT